MERKQCLQVVTKATGYWVVNHRLGSGRRCRGPSANTIELVCKLVLRLVYYGSIYATSSANKDKSDSEI